jgi:hypothetical protein
MLDESGGRPSNGDIFCYVVQYGMAPADMLACPTACYCPSYSLSSAYSFHHHHQMQMLAGTSIEYWIAQITNNRNYDERLTFLLTHRAYIDTNDLLHSIIARFH